PLKPAPLLSADFGRYVWMNDGRLEECGLKLEHARNFYLTYAPTVYRAARRRQSTLPFMRITLLPVTGRHNLMTQLRPAFMSAIGPKRTSLVAPHMSAFGGKADMANALRKRQDVSIGSVENFVLARPP